MHFISLRDGTYGTLAVDDTYTETGISPGRFSDLNVNGPVYIGNSVTDQASTMKYLCKSYRTSCNGTIHLLQIPCLRNR